MTQSQKTVANYTHVCPLCGKASCCDLDNGKATCWCFAEPVLQGADPGSENLSLVKSARCLCPDCLATANSRGES